MTTMEQQAPPVDAELDAAVEAQMGKILTELGGALGVLLTALGTRSGLWGALAGAGPVTAEQVAAKVSVDPRHWFGNGCARRQLAATSTTTPTPSGTPCRTPSPAPFTTARAGRWSMQPQR